MIDSHTLRVMSLVLVGIGLFQGAGHVPVLSDPALATPVLFASCNNGSQQEALRTALEEADAQPAGEAVGRWKAKRSLKYLLPSDATLAARVIAQIFRAGYGLSDLAEMSVWRHDPKVA